MSNARPAISTCEPPPSSNSTTAMFCKMQITISNPQELANNLRDAYKNLKSASYDAHIAAGDFDGLRAALPSGSTDQTLTEKYLHFKNALSVATNQLSNFQSKYGIFVQILNNCGEIRADVQAIEARFSQFQKVCDQHKNLEDKVIPAAVISDEAPKLEQSLSPPRPSF